MVAPYNYILPNQPNPLEAAVSGLRLGATIEEIQAARQQRAMQIEAQQAAAARAKQGQEVWSRVMQNPTAQGIMELSAYVPDSVMKNVVDTFKTMNEGRQKGYMSAAGQALAALEAGQPTIAVDRLRQYSEAAKNAGDAEGASMIDFYANMVEKAPNVGFATIGTMIAKLPGGKDTMEALSKGGTERRAQLAFTPEQAKREADASIAKTEADMRRQVLRSGINLQGAQTAAANAQANKAKAETDKIKAENQAGVIPPDKRPEFEAKLRKEYNDQTATFRDVRDAYQRIKASTPDAVGDLSLIFGYMKMLDPGSVVREGEFANAQNAAGVPEVVRNAWNRALSGERLSDNQRGAFKAQAGKLYQVQETQAKATRAGIERIGRGYGLDPKNLFYDEDAAASPAPQPPKPQGPIVVDY